MGVSCSLVSSFEMLFYFETVHCCTLHQKIICVCACVGAQVEKNQVIKLHFSICQQTVVQGCFGGGCKLCKFLIRTKVNIIFPLCWF